MSGIHSPRIFAMKLYDEESRARDAQSMDLSNETLR